MKPVLILGCGPSGLIAAHACQQREVPFKIMSKPERSVIHGSQYLHAPIPGVTNTFGVAYIHYENRGTPEEYRRKVHGEYWDGMVAPEEFETEHTGWDIRQTYGSLWARYGLMVRPMEFGGPDAYASFKLQVDPNEYSLIVSTVPRRIWRQPGDEFVYSRGWALNGRLADDMLAEQNNNTIVCDGTDGVSWSRASKVFGHATIEWPDNTAEGAVMGAARIVKPLRCTAAEPPTDTPWLFTGRYGAWHKGVVTTDVWDEVNKGLDGLT